MNIDNITSDSMSLTYNGKAMQIKVYEQEIKRLKEQLNDEIQEELKQSEIMVKKQEEIERLNNIINELEKWLDKKEKLTFNSWNKGIHEVQRKLQELKGVDKE